VTDHMFHKGGEFVDWLSDCWLLKNDSAPQSQLVRNKTVIGKYEGNTKA